MSQLLANQVRMMLHVNDGEYRIQQFDAMEGINRPLECQVVFRSDIDCNPNALLGLPVSLRIYSHDAHQRRFDGVVSVARRDATATSDCLWTVTLASKLLQGQQQHRSRLFMQLSRRDAIKKLLIEMGYQVDEIDWRIESNIALTAPLLQAQESNFDCFSRLLSEAGWNYWFEQAENDDSTCFERLVISDQQRWQPLPIGPLWLPPEHGTTAMPDTQRLTMAQRASHMKKAKSVRTQLRPGEHFVPMIGKNQSIWQRGNWESFSAPQSAEAIAQLIQRDEQQHGGAEQRLHLACHQSQLQAGYQVTIAPNRGQKSAIPGEYVVASVRHWGRQPNDQGQPGVVQYHNRAQAVRLTQSVLPALVSGPSYLPMMFPARIESRSPHYAELSNDGRYYLRAKFDEPKEQQPDAPARAAASPAIEVMVPYASPQGEQAQPIGWHFPLLNQSTVLVTCLNNDPNRPLILGFTPNHQMRGPVAHDNAQQSRMVTPAQNELTLDDHKQAPNIVLQTFNGDTRLFLHAHSAQPFIELAVRYGALSMHSAKTLLLAAKEGELKQRIGHTRREQAKHSVHHQTEGHVHWQAAAEQQWQAHGKITQVAEADLSAHAEEGQIRLTVNEQLTVTAQQGMHVHVPKGSTIVQTPSEIRIESEAELLLTSNNGKAGMQMTPNKVTLFGNDVTLKGSQAVNLNGDVHYDKGGNEPVKVIGEPYDPPEELNTLSFEPPILAQGNSSYYNRPDNDQVEKTAPTFEKGLTLKVQTKRGSAVVGVSATFTNQDGQTFMGTSDETGTILFQECLADDHGDISYDDLDKLAIACRAADLKRSLDREEFKGVSGFLATKNKCQEVIAHFENHYEPFEPLLKTSFPNEYDQEALLFLLSDAGIKKEQIEVIV